MPTSLFQRAHKFYSKGNLKKAEDCCKLAIANDAGDYKAYNLLGVMAINAKKFGDAHSYLQMAVGIKSDYAEGYNNLGAIYNTYGMYEDAKLCYNKAVTLEPDYVDAYYNLGTTLQKQKTYDQAILCYEIALNKNPNMAMAYNNIANILDITNSFEESLPYYNKAIEIDPTISDVYLNLSTAMLYMYGSEEWKKYLENHVNKVSSLSAQKGEMLSSLAVANWIEGNLDKVSSLINESISLMVRYQDYVNFKQVMTFNNFLQTLISWYSLNRKQQDQDGGIRNTSVLYFLGDSHGLICANKVFKIRDKDFLSKSLFIRGCKIWHLINEQSNRYKFAFNREVSAIANNSTVILTIGEIDCRHDEGIFKRHLQKKCDWKDSVDILVSQYFKKVIAPLQEKNINIYIWGIPSPNVLVVNKLCSNDRSEFIAFSKYMNEQMCYCSSLNNVKFINNYLFTVDANGLAVEGMHLDDVHLNPDTFFKVIYSTLEK